MAMAPPRPCSHPKCGAIGCTKPEHRSVAWRAQSGPPLVKRIRGRELQRRRARLFARSPWCVGDCLALGIRTRATIRDHIVPLAEGGTEDERNEQALCLDCSDAKTEDESRRGVARSQMTPTFRKSATPRSDTGRFSRRRDGWTR
jgi:5-methylcytosine-specific restriction protein A